MFYKGISTIINSPWINVSATPHLFRDLLVHDLRDRLRPVGDEVGFTGGHDSQELPTQGSSISHANRAEVLEFLQKDQVTDEQATCHALLLCTPCSYYTK